MSNIDRLFPRWARSWGALAQGNALVRSQCLSCGIQHRVVPSHMALRFGASSPLVDQLDACNVVGCHGMVYFMVARSYGRTWLNMFSGETIGSTADAAPAANAVSLDLIRTPAMRR